jgi:CRP-like cAMP-binding protein
VRLFNQDTKVEALRRAPLFEGLSKKDLTQLARVSEDMELDAGQVLTRQGETGHEFFVIVDGTIEVEVNGQSHGERGGGDFVGEIALIEDIPRTATVKAKTPLRVFVLTRQDFRRIIDENPGVERKVMQALARRLVDLSRDPTVA